MAAAKVFDINLSETIPEHVLKQDSNDETGSDGSIHGSVERSEEDSEGEEMEDAGGSEGNPGWADAMAKILKTKKPKGKKSIVLSKAKKLNMIKQITKEPTPGFEIEGEIKDEKPEVGSPAKQESMHPKEIKRVKKKEWELKGRLKPSALDRNREKVLSKIATKGVVQLFNAVREHQKSVSSRLQEAGSSERKREKVLKSIDKRAFLDVLMGSTKSEIVDSPMKVDPEIKAEDIKPSTWQVLRDDFMMGARLKDWDKQEKVPVPSKEDIAFEESDDDDDDDDDNNNS